MKFEMVKELDEEKFRRLTGVKRTTFDRMIEILGAVPKTSDTPKHMQLKPSPETFVAFFHIVLLYVANF